MRQLPADRQPRLAPSVQREFDARLAEVEAIARVTVTASELMDAATLRATRGTIQTLERLHRELRSSDLPDEQQRVLRDNIDCQLRRYDRLLDQAAAAAQRQVAQAVDAPPPPPKRGGLAGLVHDLERTLDRLDRSLFS